MADQSLSTRSIKVPLVADMSGLGKGLKQAATSVDKFYAGVGKTLANSPFGKATKAVADFGKGFAALGKSTVAPLQPLAAGLASIGKQAKAGIADVLTLATGVSALAVAGLAAGAAFATGGLKRIGELGQQSASIGIASDKLSELQFAARASGASAEDLNGFLKGLTATVHGAVGQINPASEAFKRLGTSAEALKGLTVDKQFETLKAGFDALPTAAAKAQAAVDIGGEAGLKLFKLLGMGAKEFEQLKAKSASTGFTISPEALAKVQAANNAFSQIGMVFDGLINQLTVALAPAVTYVSDLFTAWFAETFKDSQFFDTMIAMFVAGFARLADTAVGISLVFRDVFAGIASAVGGAIGWIGKLLDAVAMVVPGMQGVADSVKGIATTVKGFGEAQAASAAKAREAFEKSKPSESINKAFADFKSSSEKAAQATATNTKASQGAATSDQELLKSVTDLKQAFRNTISDSGLTAEQKQIAELKRRKASLSDILDLTMQVNAVREAGKRDSLAEDLRESTKLPFEKFQEDLNRINQLVAEGKITKTQALRGAAMKAQESGLTGETKFAGALSANSIEGRSYLLSQQNRMTDPLEIARQGLAASNLGNTFLARIATAAEKGGINVFSM